ncbi:MAG: Clp protease ClpP [Clostridiales bacterium]|nr:Clp protease ClpP [Clostridiales bacterium]
MPKRYYALTTTDTAADIMVYGDITAYPWEESDVSGYNMVRDLETLQAPRINVHINSYGGDVSEALAITNALLRHPAEVVTFVDGFACSAASVIFMAGDRRIMAQSSNLLVHPAWAMAQGNAKSLREMADNLDTITEQSVTAYMARIKKTREELLELMDAERFLGPEEALDWGFATEVENLFAPDKPEQSARQLVHRRMMAVVQPEPPTINTTTQSAALTKYLAALRKF